MSERKRKPSLPSKAWSFCTSIVSVSKDTSTSLIGTSRVASGRAGIKQSGDVYNRVGIRLYEKLLNDEALTLVNIHYCQVGLGRVTFNAQGEKMSQRSGKRGLINHDYLLLVLRPGGPNAKPVCIKAHKSRDSGFEGIYIDHILDVPSSDNEYVRLFTVDCGNARIRMGDIFNILTKESADYHLIHSNCWIYAFRTAKRLLQACIKTPGISSAEKARLQTEHDNLGGIILLRHLQNVAKSTFRKAAKSLSHFDTPTPAVPAVVPAANSDRWRKLCWMIVLASLARRF